VNAALYALNEHDTQSAQSTLSGLYQAIDDMQNMNAEISIHIRFTGNTAPYQIKHTIEIPDDEPQEQSA
jgi:hypothetical protein